MSSQTKTIPLNKLTAHPQNRKDDNLEDYNLLVENIRQRLRSKLEPLRVLPVVRPLGGGWQILAGHRRVRACRELGLESLVCEVRQMDDQQALLFVLEDNLHRRNYTGVELVKLVSTLKRSGHSRTDIGKVLGYSKAWVSRVWALRHLDKKTLRLAQAENWTLNRLLTLRVGEKTLLTPKGGGRTAEDDGYDSSIPPVVPWGVKKKVVNGVECWMVSVGIPVTISRGKVCQWLKSNMPEVVDGD